MAPRTFVNAITTSHANDSLPIREQFRAQSTSAQIQKTVPKSPTRIVTISTELKADKFTSTVRLVVHSDLDLFLALSRKKRA